MESLIKQGTAGIWQFDTVAGTYIWLNVSGKLAEYVHDTDPANCDFMHPDDRHTIGAMVSKVIDDGSIQKCVFRMLTPEQTYYYYSLIVPVLQSGKVEKVIGIVSELPGVWANLAQKSTGINIFEKILATIPIDLVIFDNDYKFVYISEMAIRDTEVREYMIGKSEFDYCKYRNKPIGIAERRHGFYEQACREKRSVVFEETMEKEGRSVHKLRVFHPVMDANEEIIFMVGYGYDVTKVKESETIISRQKIAIESASDGIALLDAEGKYYYLNKAHVELFGYDSAEELIGKTYRTLYGEEEIQRLDSVVFPELMQHGKWSGETIGISKNGEPVGQEIALTPLPDGGLICICRDNSKRKKQEEELKKLALVVENTRSVVIITNKEREIEWVNKAFVDLTGYTLEEAIGKKPAALLHGPRTSKETSLFLREAFNKGEAVNCEIINYKKNGDFYWVNIHAQPLLNEKGEIDKYFAIEEDITSKKEIERQLIIAKEAAEASASAKRRFLANMSHEIRTPMNAVIGFTDLIMKTSLTDEQSQYVNTIQSAAHNLLTVINDILDISKIEEGKMMLEKIPMNLSDVVKRAISVLTLKAEEKGIGLFINCEQGIVQEVLGDPYRLNQVLLNIVGNAVKFTEKGEVELRCSQTSIDERQVMVKVQVIDTGIGMDEEMLSHAFNAFHQADESFVRKYGGTGLGLSISHSLIEMMGGKISIDSRLGAGTTVTVEIPFELNKSLEWAGAKDVKVDVATLANRKVLLVEDNQLNSIVATLMLKNAGLSVDLAVNGQEAFDKLCANQYDIVLMDIQMPILDGVSATRLIRNEGYTDVPIVALTAHALREEKEIYLEVGMNDFLTKPFKEEDLLLILSKWMN